MSSELPTDPSVTHVIFYGRRMSVDEFLWHDSFNQMECWAEPLFQETTAAPADAIFEISRIPHERRSPDVAAEGVPGANSIGAPLDGVKIETKATDKPATASGINREARQP